MVFCYHRWSLDYESGKVRKYKIWKEFSIFMEDKALKLCNGLICWELATWHHGKWIPAWKEMSYSEACICGCSAHSVLEDFTHHGQHPQEKTVLNWAFMAFHRSPSLGSFLAVFLALISALVLQEAVDKYLKALFWAAAQTVLLPVLRIFMEGLGL